MGSHPAEPRTVNCLTLAQQGVRRRHPMANLSALFHFEALPAWLRSMPAQLVCEAAKTARNSLFMRVNFASTSRTKVRRDSAGDITSNRWFVAGPEGWPWYISTRTRMPFFLRKPNRVGAVVYQASHEQKNNERNPGAARSGRSALAITMVSRETDRPSHPRLIFSCGSSRSKGGGSTPYPGRRS
jgi:hypothetical protein